VNETISCDVAIVGGGPTGSTVGSLLKLQNPELDVRIFESKSFPRDHVGESLLPTACSVLHETGAWEKVEGAGFPVKLGGLYRWGSTNDVYSLKFLRGASYEDAPRPAKYEGQRTLTAFQVDRGSFDKILLDHAAELGCQVHSSCPVVSVAKSGDRVESLRVQSVGDRSESEVVADHYIDASGTRAILRRALDVPVSVPTSLRNIAIYGYWRNANWGDRAGQDGTHIYVMSLDWGWLWFIVIGNDRTSVGLVTSAAHYKQSKTTPEELYARAIAEEPSISHLLSGATLEGALRADRDWSFVADRLSGENWFLAGDSGGFADPILSAGITLAMSGARKVAYTMSELRRGEHDPAWLKQEYDRSHRASIRDHIRFADYWYSVNAKFTDLKEYCAEIARDSGLILNADQAFQWLGTGGFAGDAGGFESPTAATFRLSTVKSMVETLGGGSSGWRFFRHKGLRLNLAGAERETCATYYQGRVVPQESYRRGAARFFLEGFYKRAYLSLLAEHSTPAVVERMFLYFRKRSTLPDEALKTIIFEVLEALYLSGWIEPMPG
jgi:flavin-dependent dehydrogenase